MSLNCSRSNLQRHEWYPPRCNTCPGNAAKHPDPDPGFFEERGPGSRSARPGHEAAFNHEGAAKCEKLRPVAIAAISDTTLDRGRTSGRPRRGR